MTAWAVIDTSVYIGHWEHGLYNEALERHSFGSHLAMRGAPARAIQELAGPQDLGTTQHYIHLSPAALDAAIRLLETGTKTSRVAWRNNGGGGNGGPEGPSSLKEIGGGGGS